MRLPQRRQFKWNYLALAFAFPCVGMLFVMLVSQYEPFGKYSMLYSDMYHQYYPFFVEFRRALCSGDGLLYTWSVGLGMDYLGLISYYLASPLNLLSVLVPEGILLEFFSLLVPIKLGLAGLFFAIFLKQLTGKDDLSISVFGGLYGLCAWALGFQWNVMWLDTFALFPLVVLGTVYLLRDKKFLLYTLALFQAIFSNYYIGFFVCIFVLLFFFIYQFCRWGGWKKFFADLGRIAFFSVLAIGMTAILELPALAALQTTQSSVNKFPTSFRLNIASSHDIKGLLDAMRLVAGNMGGSIEPNFKEGLPNVYCGIGSVVLMLLYLMAGEIKWRDKVCAVGLLLFFNVSFIIRQLDYIWHGFHFTNMIPYRFSFLYSFVVLYMAYRAWLLRKKFTPWQVAAAGFLTGSILCCSKELTETVSWELGSMTLDVPLYPIFNLVFLVLYVAALLYGQLLPQVPEEAEEEEKAAIRWERSRQRGTSRALVLGIMSLELIATLVCFGFYFTGTGVSNYPKGTDYAASVIRYMKEREDDNLFYRAETTHSQTLNDGALNGYNGVTAFTSSANVKTTEFMKALGFSAKNTYNRYLYEESSPVANLFLGLKYMIERDGKDKVSTYFSEANSFGQVRLLENNAYLPLGFLANPGLQDVDFMFSEDPFEFQNILFFEASGVAEVWQKIGGPFLTITGNGVDIKDSNSTGYCSYKAEGSGDVTYSYLIDQEGFLCINLDLPKRNDFYVSLNGVELYKETISLEQMLSVCDVHSGDVVEIRIVCDAGENSTMRISAGVLDPEKFWQGYSVLRSSTLKLTGFEPTKLEGVIQCNRAGLLYTSIPQNGNWIAEVDGQVVEPVLIGDCMMALELTEGEHRIGFRYENKAFSLGWKVSLACAAVFAGVYWLIYKPDVSRLKAVQRTRKGRFEK